MLLLGLTGDIACGKSTVAQMLMEHGAALLDSDMLVRELYADTEFAHQVADLFTDPKYMQPRVLMPDGSVDRAALASLVFKDASALRRLEALVHPAVALLRARKIAELQAREAPPPAVVLEAVKLVESGQAHECDAVWWVMCSPEVQLRRLMQDRGYDEKTATARIAAQPSHEHKHALLGSKPLTLIYNDGSREDLAKRVGEAWQHLLQHRP